MDTSKYPLSFNIEGGPSADRLIDSFKYAYSKEVKVPVSFTVVREKGDHKYAISEVTSAHIATMAHEDGSGHSFNLTGYCQIPSGETKKFLAYYNTKTRKGTMSIIP